MDCTDWSQIERDDRKCVLKQRNTKLLTTQMQTASETQQQTNHRSSPLMSEQFDKELRECLSTIIKKMSKLLQKSLCCKPWTERKRW